VTLNYSGQGSRPAAEGGWLSLSSEMTRSLDAISGRHDLMVTIAPGAGQGSPACFTPGDAWLEIDARQSGLTEEQAGELKPYWRMSDRDKMPATWGLLVHEAAHARHTKWISKIPQGWLEGDPERAGYLAAAKLLEESRIEHRQVGRRWWDARWLRMSATKHILGDITTTGGVLAAATAATLVGGRVRADILTMRETDAVLDWTVATLGSAEQALLLELCAQALCVADADWMKMTELGEQWVRAVGEPPSEDSDAPLDPALAAALGALLEGIAKNGGWPAATPARRSHFDHTWKPATAHQKVAAQKLARRLREYFIPERTAAPVARTSPPGRLNVREVIRGKAQEAAGQLPDVTPWRHVDRRVVQTPPLRVGIIVDVSGSMVELAGHSRELAYRLSTAFAALPDSRVRTMLAGVGIEAWESRPGEVAQYDYEHSQENVHLAVDDLSERLQLYRRGNARLLIVISDARWVTEDERTVRGKLASLTQAGVRVLWLDFARHEPAVFPPDPYEARMSGVTYRRLSGNPEAAVAEAEGLIVSMLSEGRTA
jgi:hypothetical protein